MEATVNDELEALGAEDAGREAAAAPPTLAAVFDAHADYVGRSLRCLGVPERELPDAIQDVFLVAHRRLAEFEGRASLRTWLYAICLRRALAARRNAARRREDAVAEPPEPRAERSITPEDALERVRALDVALAILEGLDDDKRAVFVLYEVEQLPMAEVAAVVRCPLQTAYSRLYAARREVQRALARLRARGGSP